MDALPEWNALAGARLARGDVPLPKVWQRLHDNAAQWSIMHRSGMGAHNLKALDGIDRDILGRLSGVEASAWTSLCDGAGATLMGAVGLSWCEGAALADVWAMWTSTGVPLLPRGSHRRPARLLNPELVGAPRTLSEILEAYPSDPFLACVRCARASGDVAVDLSAADIPKVPLSIARFVLHAVAIGAMMGPAAERFVDHWSRRPDVQDALAPPLRGEVA